MDTVKGFFSKELFRVDGMALTIGMVAVVALAYVMFFYKR